MYISNYIHIYICIYIYLSIYLSIYQSLYKYFFDPCDRYDLRKQNTHAKIKTKIRISCIGAVDSQILKEIPYLTITLADENFQFSMISV